MSLYPLFKSVVEGGSLTLSCKASGDGNLIFAWLLAETDAKLTAGISGLKMRSFMGGSNLTFSSAIIEDSGQYRFGLFSFFLFNHDEKCLFLLNLFKFGKCFY